jgi:hypothetical protein
MKKIISLLVTLLLVQTARADKPQFDNLSDSDLDTIAKEFSAVFLHTSVTPPASLGKIFGIEAGLILGAAEIPGIEDISKRYDPNTDLPYAPFATLFGALSVPFGITIEANLLPSTKVGGLELQSYGLAGKWTLTEDLLTALPFNLAVKGYFSQSKINFEQNVTTPIPSNVDVDFETNMMGADALIGLDWIVAEPYVGVGFVKSSSELSAVAALDPSYSVFADNTSRSKKTDVTSARLTAGCEFNLTLLKLGLEYNRVFDTNRAAMKISFAF